MARTPLFRSLARLATDHRLAWEGGVTPDMIRARCAAWRERAAQAGGERGGPSRREFLAAVAASGATALLAGVDTADAQARAAVAAPARVANQGYMEGAAAEGLRTAQAVLADLRGRKARAR